MDGQSIEPWEPVCYEGVEVFNDDGKETCSKLYADVSYGLHPKADHFPRFDIVFIC